MLVLTDFSNAFNNLDRTSFREVVRRVIPEAGPRLDFCYEEDSVLRLGKDGTWLDSTMGMQRGNH